MALRLTTASKPKAVPGRTAQAGASAVAELTARAAGLLAGGELDAYLELFERAAAIEDESRRYQARKALLERGFGASGDARPARAAEILTAVARAAVAVLEAQPAEPVLLNYAGVAFYELWSLDAAQALFTAAQRLDPALPQVRRNLAELSRRRRAAGRPRIPFTPALKELAPRARRAAERARPASDLKLSLCMIVRDEEEMLPRCLAAVAPAVDEIVIVDTGSTDSTIEIARSFGARVIEREWTGSFADARNVSFEAATGDWLLYLDADEVLVAEDAERLRSLTGQTWREAFYLVETNFTGDIDEGTAVTHNALRLFRNRPEYRFSGRLHEQIAHNLPAYVPERIHSSTVRIEHYGYLGAVRDAKEKSRRNIELLIAQQAESEPTPFLHFNLGSEYAAAGDAPAALREFEAAWEMIVAEGPGATYEFTPTLVVRLVKALRVCGRFDDAIDRARDGLARFPGFTDLVFEQGAAAQSLGRREEAIGYFERCIELGDAPARYTATLGCGTFLPRIALAELQLAAGEDRSAVELLRWCAEKHPAFFGVILPYVTAMLRTGTAPAEIVAEIERRVPKMTPTVRFMLGTGLYEGGATELAEQQFRGVLEAQPHSGTARVALAESLLAQRRNAEAAVVAAALSEDDPLAGVAVRSELFGRILDADLDGARAALERARRVGLNGAEVELFAAWIGLASKSAEQPRVPAAALPLLATMLEALLRVQDFDAFELIHPLLAATGIPVREQRELLGSLYLRHGYLQSAAREWMAVCQERPDAPALIGLAQVALAHGLPEDAANFAREARALDPANAVAPRLAELAERRAAAA